LSKCHRLYSHSPAQTNTLLLAPSGESQLSQKQGDCLPLFVVLNRYWNCVVRPAGENFMDVFTPEKRSAVMARIQAKNTKPEMTVRRIVHGLGYRYRLHRTDLPGTPDLVFPRLKKAIFVHGCFWHQHDGCQYAYKPKSNSLFWKHKFAKNTARDERAMAGLRALGWDILVVWECQTKEPAKLLRELQRFLKNDTSHRPISRLRWS
jgi:DNA mismatch endonuclease (patch repair protein)